MTSTTIKPLTDGSTITLTATDGRYLVADPHSAATPLRLSSSPTLDQQVFTLVIPDRGTGTEDFGDGAVVLGWATATSSRAGSGTQPLSIATTDLREADEFTLCLVRLT